jgi:cephalosporin hydroxylase
MRDANQALTWNERFVANNGMDKYVDIAIEAQEIYSHLWQDSEIVLAMKFLDENLDSKESGFIEVGSAMGGSFHCWASIIQNGPKISVDLPFYSSGDYAPYMVEATVHSNTSGYVDKRNALWSERFSNVSSVVGSSVDEENIKKVDDILGGHKCDFLFIDGNHSLEYIKSDFENYSKHVRSGGFVGFHDISFPGHDVGVFWDDLVAKFPDRCTALITVPWSSRDGYICSIGMLRII